MPADAKEILDGIVKLTKRSSIDPQYTGLQPVANPPCWASETAVSLNLTIPSADFRRASSDGFRQSWMSFDGFTCNEPSRGLAEEWPNF